MTSSLNWSPGRGETLTFNFLGVAVGAGNV